MIIHPTVGLERGYMNTALHHCKFCGAPAPAPAPRFERICNASARAVSICYIPMCVCVYLSTFYILYDVLTR